MKKLYNWGPNWKVPNFPMNVINSFTRQFLLLMDISCTTCLEKLKKCCNCGWTFHPMEYCKMSCLKL